MYRLSSSMSDRINFDQMVRNVLQEAKFNSLPEDAEAYFDITDDFVDDIEEAEARIKSVAEEIIAENIAQGKFKLNRDWKIIEPKLKEELQKLGADEEEIKQILDATFQMATEIDDIEKYAKEELDLLREQTEELITVNDLMIIADAEGEPRFVWKNDEHEPYNRNDRFLARKGDKFVLEYDDGINDCRVEIVYP